jgi:hypothetical protein
MAGVFSDLLGDFRVEFGLASFAEFVGFAFESIADVGADSLVDVAGFEPDAGAFGEVVADGAECEWFVVAADDALPDRDVGLADCASGCGGDGGEYVDHVIAGHR